MDVIIFDQRGMTDVEGEVGIVIPTAKELLKRPIEDIASTDVPTGKSWEIVDASVLPWNVPRGLWQWV